MVGLHRFWRGLTKSDPGDLQRSVGHEVPDHLIGFGIELLRPAVLAVAVSLP